MQFQYPEGATPLDLDEIAGLIPEHISTQAELNEWEQANILDAERWLDSFFMHADMVGYDMPTFSDGGNRLPVDAFLTVDFIQQVHKKMFDKTWRWAGKFRKSDKNIGVDWVTIPVRLRGLLDDIKYQITHHSYAMHEIAVRFHHRLVAIHPFSNGNGRHARRITDLFLRIHNQPMFSWGKDSFYKNSSVRDSYIKALRAADRHDYSQLLLFVRQ